MSSVPRFNGAYRLTVKAPDWREENRVLRHAVKQKRAEGKNVEVMYYFYNTRDGQPVQVQPHSGEIEKHPLLKNRILHWEVLARLADSSEIPSRDLETQLVWLEDDANGNDATQAQILYKDLLDAYDAGINAHAKKSRLQKIREGLQAMQRNIREKAFWERLLIEDKFRFYGLDPQLKVTMAEAFTALFQKTAKSSAMALTQQPNTVDWKVNGVSVDVTTMDERN